MSKEKIEETIKDPKIKKIRLDALTNRIKRGLFKIVAQKDVSETENEVRNIPLIFEKKGINYKIIKINIIGNSIEYTKVVE